MISLMVGGRLLIVFVGIACLGGKAMDDDYKVWNKYAVAIARHYTYSNKPMRPEDSTVYETWVVQDTATSSEGVVGVLETCPDLSVAIKAFDRADCPEAAAALRRLQRAQPLGVDDEQLWNIELRKVLAVDRIAPKLHAFIRGNEQKFTRILDRVANDKPSEEDFHLCNDTAEEIFNEYLEAEEDLPPSTPPWVVVRVWQTTGLVDNGGFGLLLDNPPPGGETWEQLAKAFAKIGCSECDAAIREAGLLADGVDDVAALDTLEIERLNKRFWASSIKEVVEKLARYIEANEEALELE